MTRIYLLCPNFSTCSPEWMVKIAKIMFWNHCLLTRRSLLFSSKTPLWNQWFELPQFLELATYYFTSTYTHIGQLQVTTHRDIEGEAEHEKITIKSYVCGANIHRQKNAACSGPRMTHRCHLHLFLLGRTRYRSIDKGLLYKVSDTETFKDQSYTVLSESKRK